MNNTISSLLLTSTLTLVWCKDLWEPHGVQQTIKTPDGASAVIVTFRWRVECVQNLSWLKTYTTDSILSSEIPAQINSKVLNIVPGDHFANIISPDGIYSTLQDEHKEPAGRFINRDGNTTKFLYTENDVNKVCKK